VSAVAAVSGAIAAALGGRLTDHLGRVRLLVPLMLLTALCCFAMTLVHSARDLLIARVVLTFVDGMAMASTAPLVRDFSPRLGRAQAFGFWTWGPVGASLIASGLAAWTLPIFHDAWRSQFVIMGGVSLVMSVVIATNVADLSPQLRARIQQTERTVASTANATWKARGRDLRRSGSGSPRHRATASLRTPAARSVSPSARAWSARVCRWSRVQRSTDSDSEGTSRIVSRSARRW
jgi:MFS family permease